MIKILLTALLCACGTALPLDTPGGPIGKGAPPRPPHLSNAPGPYGYLVRIQDQSTPFIYAYLYGCGSLPYNVTIPKGGGDDLLLPSCSTKLAIGSIPPVPPVASYTCFLDITQGHITITNPSELTHCTYKDGIVTY